MKTIIMIAIACMTMVCSASSSMTNTIFPINGIIRVQEYETYILTLNTMREKLNIENTNLERRTDVKARNYIKHIESIVKQINQI